MAAFTTFKIGGKAAFYFEPRDIQELREALSFAASKRLKTFLLGAGSNLLISDRGLSGLVLRLNSPCFNRVSVDGEFVRAGSGAKLSRLLKASGDKGLSGLEFCAGIPGTVGGALAMNAGAWGKSIADIVAQVRVIDYNGKVIRFKKRQIRFAYRASSLSRFIILGADFKLSPAGKSRVSRLMRYYLKRRRAGQENKFPNAGCIFKNPAKGRSAGELIDACGFKGKSLSAAMVSPAHANFIVNRGKARSSDVLNLMRRIRERVKSKFGVTLCPEIKIWR